MIRTTAILLLGLLCASPLAAQGDDDFRQGTHVLRRLLHDRKFEAVADWNTANAEPSRTLLILFGRPTDINGNATWLIPNRINQFLQRGGGVWVATDHDLRNKVEWTPLTNYQIIGERVSAWAPDNVRLDIIHPVFVKQIDERFTYRGRKAGLRDCVVVEPTGGPGPSMFWTSPDKRTGLRVVVNRSGYLLHQPFFHAPDVHVLARFPRGCFYSSRGFLQQHEIPPPFAVSREFGKGQYAMMADHSVFINEMMLQETDGKPDNGNLDLAFNTIEWFRDGGRRNRVLIVEDGRIQPELDIPLKEVEKPLQEMERRLARETDELLMDLQRKHQSDNRIDEFAANALNHFPGRMFGSVRSENVYLLIGLSTAVALVLIGTVALVRATHRQGLGPVFASFAARLRPRGSAAFLRQDEAEEYDDWRGLAREAAQEWFSDLPDAPQGGLGTSPPKVLMDDTHADRSRATNGVRALWRIARGRDLARMNQDAFRTLLDDIDWLSSRVASGRLHIVWS